MANQGYSFPMIPEKWGNSERQFALALRTLFDTLFSDQETQNDNIMKNRQAISETMAQLNKNMDALGSQLSVIEGKLNFLQQQINSLQE